MSRVNDLWLKKDKKTRTARWGKGKRWQAIRTDGRGGEEKKSFDFKDAATAWAHDKDEAEATTAEPVAFRDYADQYAAAMLHQAGSTKDNMGSHLKAMLPHMADKPLGGITRPDVQAMVLAWSENLAPSTIRTYLASFRAIMNSAVADELIPKSPVRKISLPKLPASNLHPLTTEDVQRVVDLMEEPFKSFAVVMAAMGPRPSEGLGMTVESVNQRKKVWKVDKQLARTAHRSGLFAELKTPYSYRDVDFGAGTAAVLKELAKSPGEEGLLFHYKGRRITHQRMQEAWGAVKEKMPLIGDGFHQLRHHHASVLLSQGASVVAVARRLGHRDGTETLKSYGHLMPKDGAGLARMSDGLVRLT